MNHPITLPDSTSVVVTHMSLLAGVVFDTPTERARSVPCPADFATITDEALAAHIAEALATPPVILATAYDIAAHRYGIESGGVTVTVTGGTHRFDSRPEREARWLALEFAATNPAFTFKGWKTLDDEYVNFTNADILTVCGAIRTHVAACFAAEKTLKENPPALSDLPAAFAALMP